MPKKPTCEELRQRLNQLEKESLEHKHLEEELARQREELEMILDSVPALIFYKDKENRMVHVNRGTVETIGKPKQEIEGRSCFELFPDKAEDYWTNDQEVMASGHAKRNIIESLETSEGTKWVQTDKIPLKDKKGNIVGVIGFAIDITARKRVEDALRQSEERHRSLVNNLPIAVYRNTPGPKGKFLMANPSFLKMFGLKSEGELKGIAVADTYMKAEERKVFSNDLLAKGSVDGVELQLRKKDGTSFWASITARVVNDENGNKAYFDCSIVDITERKRAQEALEEERNLLRTILDNVPDYIYVKDMESRYVVSNSAHVRFLKKTRPEEVVGKTVFELFPEQLAAEYYEDDQEVIRSGEPILNKEEPTLDLKDEMAWNQTTKVPLRDSSGKVIGLVGIARDITERKQAEEEKGKLQAQLLEAQKMEAIATLAGGMAHNFNNLLMGIMGNASLMLLETDPNDHNYERLKNIEKSVQGGSKLTNQLLGYARKGGYEIKPLNLNRVVQETSETFDLTRKEIRVHQELAEDLFTIKADQGQIEQVLLNLYVNAADAMPGGGDLFLKTTNVTHEDMSSKPSSVKSGNYVLLTVTDAGVGMDTKTMEHIFDPFFTTKRMGRGTGLGLASVYGIIEAHGGYIDVNSRKGHGTTFSIYLPASPENQHIKEDKKLPKKLLKGQETILLVDDEEMILDVGKEFLTLLGYRVLGAGSGKDAIGLYREKKDKIDMVLLDMIMPDMGGGETYDRLKEINPEIKVLLASGYSLDGGAKEIVERGCDGFIQKPFNMEELSRRIREVLEKK
jgi:two-component system cell cycle sensor histidine kinase/response regulator CckA